MCSQRWRVKAMNLVVRSTAMIGDMFIGSINKAADSVSMVINSRTTQQTAVGEGGGATGTRPSLAGIAR